jgi:seryl-tRNA synthetase
MIDIKHLVENPELYTKELEIRNMNLDLAKLAKELYFDWKSAQSEVDGFRQEQNKFNETVLSLEGQAKTAGIVQMKELSAKLKNLEAETKILKEKLDEVLFKLPNPTWEGIPVGLDDSANIVTAEFGIRPEFGFKPKNYFELPAFKRDYLGEKGVEAVGSRGYYIKGQLAKLQRCLFNYILEKIIAEGFDYVIPPLMVNEKVMYGTGFFPSGKNDYYSVNPGEDDLFLVGSSEPSLMFMESGNILDLETPRLLTANTSCFRREAGTYGKDTQGGIRVHQFEKIETVVICKPEESTKMFDKLGEIFTQNMLSLGLCIHHLEVSSGDIGIKNYRQVDIEAWFPAQNTFRELCSNSNCTDYQTRNLNIRYKNTDGEVKLAHSLNCTGVTNRAMFAILEQFQEVDGRVKIPEVLVSSFGSEYLE